MSLSLDQNLEIYLQDLNNAGAPISPAFDPANREHWLAINEMGVVSEQTYETNGIGFVCQFIGIPTILRSK